MAAAWLNQVFNFLAGAQYATSPSAITPGSSGPLLCDQYARLYTVPFVPVAGTPHGTLWADSGALVTSLTVKSTPGNVLQLIGYNAGAAGFIQVHNAVSLPTNGTAPVYTFPVPAGVAFSLDLSARPRSFATGIVVVLSSTGPTLTSVATSLWANVEYV